MQDEKRKIRFGQSEYSQRGGVKADWPKPEWRLTTVSFPQKETRASEGFTLASTVEFCGETGKVLFALHPVVVFPMTGSAISTTLTVCVARPQLSRTQFAVAGAISTAFARPRRIGNLRNE